MLFYLLCLFLTLLFFGIFVPNPPSSSSFFFFLSCLVSTYLNPRIPPVFLFFSFLFSSGPTGLALCLSLYPVCVIYCVYVCGIEKEKVELEYFSPPPPSPLPSSLFWSSRCDSGFRPFLLSQMWKRWREGKGPNNHRFFSCTLILKPSLLYHVFFSTQKSFSFYPPFCFPTVSLISGFIRTHALL